MSLRALSILTVAAWVLTACGPEAADCPSGTRRSQNLCRQVCSSEADCLATERCDEEGLCVARQGGRSDAAAAKDATERDEAGAPDAVVAEPDAAEPGEKDAEPRDAGARPDAGKPDAFVPDADPSDAGQLRDALPRDAVAADARIRDGAPRDLGHPDAISPDDAGFAPDAPEIPDMGPGARDGGAVGPSDSGVVNNPDAGSCEGLDEPTCRATAGCSPHYCNICDNAPEYYVGCGFAGGGVSPCPQLPCPPPCADLHTEDACRSSNYCHAVYEKNPICVCFPLDCCMEFSSCAPRATASCQQQPATCGTEPVCVGDSYTRSVDRESGCWEGCVRRETCAP